MNRTLASRGPKRRSRKANSVVLRCTLAFAASLTVLPVVYFYRTIETRHDAADRRHPHSPPHQPPLLHERLEGFRNRDGGPGGHARDPPASKGRPLDGPVLTAYLEPPETLTVAKSGLFRRNTSADRLRSVTFPDVRDCDTLMEDFPVDAYPLTDPFLPWIHDYFPSDDGRAVQFVAQNRRRCDTGDGEAETMKFWEPQVSLFQGVPVEVVATRTGVGGKEDRYRLAPSRGEATHNATRFQCRFHTRTATVTTLSVHPFDYEYVTWRKGRPGSKGMFDSHGKDTALFWLSQLLFSCPVPEEFQTLLLHGRPTERGGAGSDAAAASASHSQPVLHMDLIPIRTPPRTLPLLTSGQLGPYFSSTPLYDLEKSFGKDQILPNMDDAGRWQNLPICRRHDSAPQVPPLSKGTSPSLHGAGESLEVSTLPDWPTKKPFRLVACTWTSSSYTRRGDAVRVTDSAKRLREWIHFHLMVGVDHVYIYDNTDAGSSGEVSDLRRVAESFGREVLTYHVWPAKICNNNRPGHRNPGERSSQYGAESSCRARYGGRTEWMTFLDTDEYMVPMKPDKDGDYNWHPVLDDMEIQNISIMKFRSSRGKLRIELTEELEDQSICADPVTVKGPNKDKIEPCVGPMRNKTFLQAYNCEYIRPPKPSRFDRAMKQIYRPSFVLSHFVHYSTVTKDMDQSYSDYKALHNGKEPIMQIHDRRWQNEAPEMFISELTQGALIHARSVLPHETRRRSSECFSGSTFSCILGFRCEDDVKFVDELHQQNVFKNSDGTFCNCWRNGVIEEVLVPKLERLLFIAD